MSRPFIHRHRPAAALFALVCAASLWLPAWPAAAQDVEKLFATAQELYDQHQCDAALPLFRKLHDQTSSPNARLYIARCYRQQGKMVEAYTEMQATLADAEARAALEDRYEPTRLAAATELKEL
ncbi:MAG TPA: hypothetical protein ENK23_08750, partial [Sorangium sp.]|nr:hypothetical protein [Sorangium sp.]